MECFEYIQMPIKLITQSYIDKYELWSKTKSGFVYMEIRNDMYGLLQDGVTANQFLRKRLAKYRYYKVLFSPGLWKHHLQLLLFTLVVDNFGIKFVNKRDLEHLLKTLIELQCKNWLRWWLCCRITLHWNYEDRYIDISMLGCIKKQLPKYEHIHKWSPQESP